MWKPCLLALVAVVPCPLPAQDVALPLFSSNDVLELTLEANFDKLKGDRKQESEYRPAVLRLTADDGSERAIGLKIKTRGKFRLKRSTCSFPPLRLNFPKGSLAGTVLDGQNKIKLVTHCRDRSSYEQNVIEEYLVYRSYNLMTDNSFRARLARITYVDSRGKDDPETHYAFFIEEDDAMAERLGGRMLEVKQVHPMHLSARDAVRLEVFQYMVGNTDWSMVYFHNIKLLRSTEGLHLPIPYDFDWAGFVSPPYARPDPSLDIRSVKDRIYRGFCRPQFDFGSTYGEFLELRPQFEELYRAQEGLDEDRVKDALKYVDDFYEVISSNRAERRIERACRPS